MPGEGAAMLLAVSPRVDTVRTLGALGATELEQRLQAASRRRVARQTCGCGTFQSKVLEGSEV